MNAAAVPDPVFWDRIAPRYAKKPVPDEEAYRLTLERVAAHLKPGDRVLEVGCGTGTTALKLAPHAGEILATDVSPGMIAIAEQKAAAQGIDNVRFAPGTLEEPALESGSFDAVMAFNLIHLIGDVPAFVRRIHSLLKPGGLFISKTPCIGESNFLVHAMIRLMRAVGRAPFVNRVTKESLQASIADAGFEIVETGLYPAKSHSLFVVGRK